MTKHDLKEMRNLGAELGAAKAENDRLRGLLEAALYYVPSNKTELRTLIDTALSQQAEPVEPAPAQDEQQPSALAPYTPKGDWSFERLNDDSIVVKNGKDWTVIKAGKGPIYEQFLYRFCEAHLNAAPIAQSAQTELVEALDWLDTEVSAIDTWYRGSPSYERDAGWFKAEVLRMIEGRRAALAAKEA
ncbi:hypothetical protein [Stutzerimonas stutzeri]|uniref:hypothetical protein n=1 Tax=Stutzerimonas stutzeri TaxID=316 RepID=UPI0002ED18D0|nr:hypothetical protein [Stutzerimonas stutzeri]